MHVIHLRRDAFAGAAELRNLCLSPSGRLFASGFIGPGPEFGRLLQIQADGSQARIGQGLTRSYCVAFDPTTATVVASANDGTTPNRPSAPNGLYRVNVTDGTCTVITRDVTGGGNIPVAVDANGNIYHPGIVEGDEGYSLVRRGADGSVVAVASAFRQIVGIACGDDGVVFVADAESTVDEGVLLRVSGDGKVTVLFCEDGLRPHAVAVGSRNLVFFSTMRGSNCDAGEIYSCTDAGAISLVADGFVQAGGLAYDSTSNVLYALDFLNFNADEPKVPVEYHNDSLILSITAERDRVPDPFYQPSTRPSLGPTLPEARVALEATTESPGHGTKGKRIGYSPGKGPRELADELLVIRQRYEQVGILRGFFLSDAAIQKLVEMTYFASCLEEEGHFPRFRVVAGTYWDTQHAVRLGPFPRFLERVKDLRKLAPAAAFRGSAIVFDEERTGGEHSRLICRGICDSEHLIGANLDAINSIEESLVLNTPTLVIRVEGPGYVKVGILPGPILTLRGGVIRELNPVCDVPCVQDLFSQLGDWLHSHLPTDGDGRVRTFFGNPRILGRVMARMWSRVLWHVSDRRRGGTFVILPRMKGHWRDSATFNIAPSYRSQLNFGKALIDGVLACLHATPASGRGFGEFFRLTWQRSRGERERLTRMLADLANVDGCVVLDRRLNVLGFGGKIQIPVEQLEGFGARHGSARAWCAKHPGGMAFVVSQDGDVRVFDNNPLSSVDIVDAGTSVLEFC